MREISPANNISADEFLKLMPPEAENLVSRIREEKLSKTRPLPSEKLIDDSRLLEPQQRHCLLDAVAAFVDENLFGRAEMCLQFADLLQRGLAYLGLPSRGAVGEAIYYVNGTEIFRWGHAWVRIGDEVVDGNVDCLYENPMVPSTVIVSPYWGPITKTPPDRKLREDRGRKLPPDTDVSEIWWPELQDWIDKKFGKQVKP